MLRHISLLMMTLALITGCQPSSAPSELRWRAPNSVEEHQAKTDYTVNSQMSDRSYVESVLLQVFDASGTPAAAYILSDIYQKVEFGGACDYYAASDLNATTFEFSREVCTNGISVVQTANNNPMRYSLTTKVCERLVLDSARMTAVKSKIYGKGPWGKPDKYALTKAWGLFFQVDPLDETVAEGLMTVAEVSGGNETAWKNIILTLCISPEWQAL